jgi:hypothetical protein
MLIGHTAYGAINVRVNELCFLCQSEAVCAHAATPASIQGYAWAVSEADSLPELILGVVS